LVEAQKELRVGATASVPTSGTLRGVLVLIGFTAVVAQIVLMRELIVVFCGNEISLGLMLANWLLWTAIGSGLLGRLAWRVSRPRLLMAGLQVLIAVTFPMTILAVRLSKAAFQSVPGEILGPAPMFVTSLVTLSFFCVVSGWLFAAGSRLYADEVGASTAAATGAVYLLEALGSGLGGILASLMLIRYLTAFDIASFLALLNLLAAVSLAVRSVPYRRATAGAILALFVFVVFPFFSRRLETMSLARLWRGFRLVATRNSVYGNLAVVQTEATRTLFENGLVVLSVPDPAAAEEAVHYALLQHPSPRSLLLVGGGVNGSLVQALQHLSLERVDYVELDPAILDVARQHFPREWAPIQADPRIRIHNTDGRLFLKTMNATFDVIIVNLPDPQTAQLNRFYTVEFFREAAQKLTSDGVLSFRVTAAENYISPELAEFLRCLNRTLRAVFREVKAIPGAEVHFFAASHAGALTIVPSELISRLRSRRIRTDYVREYYLPFRLSPDRLLDLESQIEPQPETPINRDFAPIAYYYDVALWSSRFHGGWRQWFTSFGQIRFRTLMGGLALTLFVIVGLMSAVAALYERRTPTTLTDRRYRIVAGSCVGVMGFTLIALEVLLLLGFQAIYGYVYHQLAILIAALMVGMAMGARLALPGGQEPTGPPRAAATRRSEIRALAALQLLAAGAPILLYVLLDSLAGVRSPVGLFLVSQILFPVLALLSGVLGGYQFPLASRIYFFGMTDSPRSPGALYSLDLVGACLGAVLLSAYLFPVFGFFRTALLMAMANLAPAALAALAALAAKAPPS
jgi:spermidine synthase